MLCLAFCALFSGAMAAVENFPSLLTTNATIAVVLDKEYLMDKYEDIREGIEKYFVYSKREILKHGGVNVQYYSWSNINVKRDITAILSVAPCEDTWNLYRAAMDEHILFMAITESDCPRLPQNLTVTIPLTNPGEELPQILLDLRSEKAYVWKKAIVFYDWTLERDMVTKIVTSLTGHNSGLNKAVTTDGLSLTILRLEMQSTALQQRQYLMDTFHKVSLKQLGNNFLMIVSVRNVWVILEVAKQMKMVDPSSQWLYVISDYDWKSDVVSNFASLIKEGDNIAFLYNVTSNRTDCKSGILCHSEELLEGFTVTLDGAVEEEQSLSTQVSEEEWEAIRPSKVERRDFLLRGVRNHAKYYSGCNNCSQWQMKAGDTWGRSFITNFPQELVSVGSWRPVDGVTFSDVLFPHISHKFRGRTLPLVTFHNPPWQILTINETGGISSYRGLVFDIIRELSRRLNFTYTIHLSKLDISEENDTKKDNNMVEVTNVVPDDIIEMVRNKKVILGACGFTVNTERKTIINFTTPISVQTYSFIVARPKELSRALLFMFPFTPETWLCLASFVLVMGPILYIINRLSPLRQIRPISFTRRGLNNLQDCMWYMYGALLQQGGMYLPESDSGRVVIGTWWLVVLVVVTTYCGNLVAFLTFPKIDLPISKVDDLITHREEVTWGTIKGTFLEQHLKDSEERKYKILYSKLILHDKITPEIISLVRQRKHIFIDWKTKLQYVMKKQLLETGECDFVFVSSIFSSSLLRGSMFVNAIGEASFTRYSIVLCTATEDFLDEQIAIIVAQNNPYLPMINREITRLHQFGLIEKWLKDYLPKKDRCSKVGHIMEVHNHTVNLNDMQGSFFVLFLGFVIAATFIIGERCLHRKKFKRDREVIKPFVS